MKKLFALLLAVIMLLSMVACAEVENTKDDDEETTTEEKKESKTEEKTEEKEPESPVVGEWEFSIDFGPHLKTTYESQSSTAEIASYMDFTKMKMRAISLKLTADGKAVMTPSDKLEDDVNALGMTIAEGMEAYVQAKLNKTLQEAMGKSKEEYAENMAGSFNLDVIAGEETEGTWTLEGDEITLTDEDGEELIIKFDEDKVEMSFELPTAQGYEAVGVKK